MRLLLLAGFVSFVLCQSEDDSALHFSNLQNGRAVWIVDESSLPWVGSYEYLSSLRSPRTVLMTVVDSSTGRTLGQCTTESHGSKWVRFQWALASDSMQCTVSPTNSSRVTFPATDNPRTFSVRIQAAPGPACVREMMVQNERPLGCPPHLAKNSFSSLNFDCSCPYEAASSLEEQSAESGTPQFPIFSLGTPSVPTQENGPAWAVSPCANYQCMHNGTCVVAQDGKATCLCENGYIGAQCEVDVCSTVPCQNGGICRANGGEAVCECPPTYTGLLCESSVCNPSCTNGECIISNGTARCACTQGFIGINCNVLDVCLGDAACAMFGENAKCVLEPSNYILQSPSLVNATYDCKCPHPVNGEFVDCLELHLASVAPSSLATVPPAFPQLNIHGIQGGELPGLLPTTTQQVPVTTTGFAAQTSATDSIPTRPTFSIHPLPQFPQTSFIPTGGEGTTTPSPFSGVQSSVWTPVPTVAETVVPIAPSTFVFPQTPETTMRTTVVDHQATHSIRPQEEEEFEDSEEEEEEMNVPTPPSTFPPNPNGQSSFPTPAPMDTHMGQGLTHTQEPDFNPFHSLMTSTTIPTVESTDDLSDYESSEEGETATDSIEMTTTPEMDYEEHEVDTTQEVPTTTTPEITTRTTVMVTVPSTEASTVPPETTTQEPLPSPTTQSSLPFWMLSSTDSPNRIVTSQPERPEIRTQPPFVPQPSEESMEEETENTEEDYTELLSTPPPSTVPEDVHQQETAGAGRQKSSAASWIVAIVALIVLGLLLLAASLFVLRYIKQSRKLHGKYNPAREEHALSAAYSMPMSHITKEERLI